MTDTAAARKPLTDASWDDHRRTGITPDLALGWEREADLGHALADMMPNLSVPQARLLIGAVRGGLPVILTWDTYLPGLDQVERTETAVIVTQVFAPTGPHFPGQARVSYWGFGHPVYLDRIVDVRTYDAVRTYRSRPDDE